MNKLNFDCTCEVCPEQYDVYDKFGNRVGYIRLRWGGLTCEYPDVGGERIYFAKVGDKHCGRFPTERSREYHLHKIEEIIIEKMKEGKI